VLGPQLLLADEPVSMRDVSVRAGVLALLDGLRKNADMGILMITHDLSTAAHFADKIAVMYLGRIVELAPTEELFRSPRHPYTRGLLAAIPRLADSPADSPPALRGDPPSPLRIPSGCRFRTRCPIAQEICSREDPALLAESGDQGHRAACHFAFADTAQEEQS
jgi:oligopeptide/dipeptide ABC transporter ATP-binding protein